MSKRREQGGAIRTIGAIVTERPPSPLLLPPCKRFSLLRRESKDNAEDSSTSCEDKDEEEEEKEEREKERAKFFARLAPKPCIQNKTIVFIPRKIDRYFCNKCRFCVYVYGDINKDCCDLCGWLRYQPFVGDGAEQADAQRIGDEECGEPAVFQRAERLGEQECAKKATTAANKPLESASFSVKPTCFERFYDAIVTKRKPEKNDADRSVEKQVNSDAGCAAEKQVGLLQSIIDSLAKL